MEEKLRKNRRISPPPTNIVVSGNTKKYGKTWKTKEFTGKLETSAEERVSKLNLLKINGKITGKEIITFNISKNL